MFEPLFTNRDENGYETNVDGHNMPYDSDLGRNDDSRVIIEEEIIEE